MLPHGIVHLTDLKSYCCSEDFWSPTTVNQSKVASSLNDERWFRDRMLAEEACQRRLKAGNLEEAISRINIRYKWWSVEGYLGSGAGE